MASSGRVVATYYLVLKYHYGRLDDGIPPEMRTKHDIQVPKLREDYARTQDLDIANSVFRSRKGAPKFCLLESTLGRPHKGAL